MILSSSPKTSGRETLSTVKAQIWGNPYIRLLRSQLETYIAQERGSDYLATVKAKAELRAIAKEMREIEQRLTVLRARKATIEELLHKTH